MPIWVTRCAENIVRLGSARNLAVEQSNQPRTDAASARPSSRMNAKAAPNDCRMSVSVWEPGGSGCADFAAATGEAACGGGGGGFRLFVDRLVCVTQTLRSA